MPHTQGYTNFDRVTDEEETTVDTPCDAHYLHSKHFEMNNADALLPLDKWLGPFHQGSF